MNPYYLSPYRSRGFAVVTEVITPEEHRVLAEEADRILAQTQARGGARNVLHRSEGLTQLADGGAPKRIAADVLGASARPTKLTLFNKTPEANWLIRWHQDLNITVQERRETPGFDGWSVKEGVVHVRPPSGVLQNILAIRLHLDDTPATNGALRVLPGSHRLGRLTREQIQDFRSSTEEVVCEVPSRGAMLMSPLLLHASSKSVEPTQRRVLHFEYSAESLPGGLAWA